jgi:hypothetical protein
MRIAFYLGGEVGDGAAFSPSGMKSPSSDEGTFERVTISATIRAQPLLESSLLNAERCPSGLRNKLGKVAGP